MGVCSMDEMLSAYSLSLFNKEVVAKRTIICNRTIWYKEFFDILTS